MFPWRYIFWIKLKKEIVSCKKQAECSKNATKKDKSKKYKKEKIKQKQQKQ